MFKARVKEYAVPLPPYWCDLPLCQLSCLSVSERHKNSSRPLVGWSKQLELLQLLAITLCLWCVWLLWPANQISRSFRLAKKWLKNKFHMIIYFLYYHMLAVQCLYFFFSWQRSEQKKQRELSPLPYILESKTYDIISSASLMQ